MGKSFSQEKLLSIFFSRRLVNNWLKYKMLRVGEGWFNNWFSRRLANKQNTPLEAGYDARYARKHISSFETQAVNVVIL
jgi:hypothetical protein